MCEQCEPLFTKPDRAGWYALALCAGMLALAVGLVALGMLV